MTSRDLKVCLLGPFWSADVAGFLNPEDGPALEALPGMGGFSLSALARLRLQRGLPTEVITLDPRAESARCFERDGFRYTVCPRRARGMGRTLYRREVAFLRDALRRSDADVVHANWAYEYALAALGDGRPALVTVRDHSASVRRQVGWGYLPNFLITQYVLRRARFLSAVSPYNAAYAARVSGKPVPVVPNCASPACLELGERLAARAPSRRGLTMASAISSVAYKNPGPAVEAFARVRAKHPFARYRLMGPGLDPEGGIAAWARGAGLSDGVEFMGSRPHEESIRVFAESDIILHPSLEEACSSTVIEAMALGKPIVAGLDAGGTPWVLGEGSAGLLVDVRRPAAIADAILRLHSDPELADALARAAYSRARSSFGPDVVLKRYAELYESIRMGWTA